MELSNRGNAFIRRDSKAAGRHAALARHAALDINVTAGTDEAPAALDPNKLATALDASGIRGSSNDSSMATEFSRFRVMSSVTGSSNGTLVGSSNSTLVGEKSPAPPSAENSLPGGRATAGLRCINCLLAVAACVLIYYSRVRPAPRTTSAGLRYNVLGFESGFQIAIFLAYVVCSCAHMFLQRRAGSTGYSVISATIVIYSLKCICAFLMYVCKGGRDFSTLLEPVGGTRFGRLPACVLTLIPGGCLGCYDALSFKSLAALDPVTYQIILHLRLVFIALLWQCTFRRQLTSTQWFALLLFAVASTTKGIEQIRDFGPAVHQGLHIALVQILMAVGGNVMAECLLKEVPVDTDLLNTCLYLEGLVVLLFVVCITQGGPSAVQSTLLAPMAWKELISDPWMVSSIVCMVMFGIVTAYFLRELSNLLKELSASFVIVASAAMEWGLLGSSSCTALGFQAVMLAILAVGVYNADPLEPRRCEGSFKRGQKF